MCIRMPIPPTLTVPFDPDAVQQHPFDMDYESDAETIPWTFNANAAKAAQKWTITIPSGSTYTMTQTINSNEIAVYRAVPAGAP